MSRPRAVVVDDHRLLAQSLAISLRQEGVEAWVEPPAAPRDLLRRVVEGAPDVVLLDLDLGPEGGDGVALVAPLVASGCRVLVVTASHDAMRLEAALDAGALGVLDKTEPVEVLLAAARDAARGEQVLEPEREARIRQDARARRASRGQAMRPFERLTEREAQVLRSLAEGYGVGAIASASYVSEATVRSQVRGVLTKLGVGSQLEAVALAHRAGWLSPSAW